AVIRRAETGVDESLYDDSRAALIRAYVSRAGCEDTLMNTLRAEAIFAPEPIRSIGRIILQHFAADGHDPTQPLFEQGKIPKPEMTCGWVALSLVRFPFGLVDQAYHERLAEILDRFSNAREQLDGLSDSDHNAWFE